MVLGTEIHTFKAFFLFSDKGTLINRPPGLGLPKQS